ncbi:O-antigen ligase family protein [Priestia abyssalis]|uniref:O-antigen ligase family protein n=1 Tax=Priestia abyssalis TaxID=1221450 RepID=UPI0009950FC2|nr:O-antigen ligase family protein [Priestia abyssalis]
MINKVLNTLLFIWFLIVVFDSNLRYFLVEIGFPQLLYIKNMFFLVLIIVLTGKIIKSLETPKFLISIIAIIIIGLLFGVLNNLDYMQIGYGLYIFMPLIAGSAFSFYYMNNKKILLIMYRIFVPLIFLGLILDAVMDLPWEGFSYSIGGIELEGNRSWTISGLDRLSGFQRSSYDSAFLLISLMSLYIIYTLTEAKKIRRVIWEKIDTGIYILGIISIVLTTSKSTYLSVILLTVLWGSIRFYRSRMRSLIFLITKLCFGILFVYSFFPPLISFTGNYSIDSILNEGNILNKFFFQSYNVRMTYMWPNAFNLLESSNFTPLGRGIGGIGSPQSFFERDVYNAADNFFVYIFVMFGLIGLFLSIYLVLRLLLLDLNKIHNYPFIFLCVIVFSIGATANVIESPVLLLLLGILLGEHCRLLNQVKQTKESFEMKEANGLMEA